MCKFFRIAALLAVLAAALPATWAQSNAKIAKIGYLSVTDPAVPRQVANLRGLRQGLAELGYVEGKNFVLELRFAQGRLERLPELAADLLRQKVDIIVSGGPAVTLVAKQATSSVPIIMMWDPDPVKAGFVASLAQPGGNITGNSSLGAELIGKQMELLKVLLPKMSKIAVLGDSNETGNAQALKEAETAARALGMQLIPLNVLHAKDIDSAMDAVAKANADAILVLPTPIIVMNQGLFMKLAVQHRLPASYTNSDFVEVGGLMAYSANQAALIRGAAVYIDKILKGRKPADLPVEQPTRFDLVFNMKTARAMGLTVPQSFLVRVDRLIE